jgi:hypothetical protein
MTNQKRFEKKCPKEVRKEAVATAVARGRWELLGAASMYNRDEGGGLRSIADVCGE